MPEPTVLIAGLGNPGKEYARHRHNVGFQAVEALARAHGLDFGRRRGAQATVAEGTVCGRPVLLVKPQGFMNLSGRSVGRLSRQYGIPAERVLVVYDDLDLPLGRLRIRAEGGSGGHKGVRSIIESLGTQSFPRLRVGIDRPPPDLDPADYVLRPFGKAEMALLSQALATAVAAIECWLAAGMVAAMDRFNRPPSGDGPNPIPEPVCQEKQQ